MEAIEEPPPTNAVEEGVKGNTSDEIMMNAEASVEMDLCHTSNGVAELKNEQDTNPVVETTVADDVGEPATFSEEFEDYGNVTAATKTEVAEVSSVDSDDPVCSNELVETYVATDIHEAESTEDEIIDGKVVIETEVVEESIVEVDGIVDSSAGNIMFETEIFIENHTSELDDEMNAVTCDEPDSSNILSELGQNIELSDVLRSSDVSETVENNNCEQEVFNKEELLDILEGNDVEQSRKTISENFHADSKKLEEHLALQQLNRLKGNDSRKRSRYSPKKPEKKQPKRSSSNYVPKETTAITVDETQNAPNETNSKVNEISSQNAPNETKAKVNETSSSKAPKLTEKPTKESIVNALVQDPVMQNPKVPKLIEKPIKESTVNALVHNPVLKKPKAPKITEKPKKESIVNALVQDWSDDDLVDPQESNTVMDESDALLESTVNIEKSQESVAQERNDSHHVDESSLNNADTSVTHDQTINNVSVDEAQPQRRLGRVIKKKVIFDPDNPDTFTKTKVHIKKEREALPEKEVSLQSTPKKSKMDHPQIHKIKSVSKMQWKKPQPKNSKQSSKRLTEIDKLLMDEGAVNMICQLTPDALKGNKNMKSKAEYIKNIQSNTPDSKEMKFRERKSKLKYEEGDSKKSGNGKNRISLNSSVKSPTASEDFENHSADDSIIYRRHSSSSYSSPCMSPRRLSDVEGGLGNQNALGQLATQEDVPIVEKKHDLEFGGENTSTLRRDVMNKSDCLSIKEKLNSKLSQALNKRKLSVMKSEKASKVKKVMPVEEVSTDVTIHFNQKLAEICIRKAGSLFSIQIMKVLENILSLVDSNKDIAVTLITSECGTVCSGLDLKPILDDVKCAQEIAEHARSLMLTLKKHSKLVLVGVEGKTQGFSLALAALSDVLLASENATFILSERSNAVLHPGAGVLTCNALPQNLLHDLIVFGREVSSAQALQGGLVSRVVWPERFQEQVRAIATDIAAQPYENIMLKKQLLGLKKAGSASTFQTCLEKEQNLLVNYWTCAEGMELLRTGLDAA